MNGILICLLCDDMKWEIYLHIEAIKKKCSAVWRLWVIDVKSVHYCTERPTWLHIKKKIKPCVSQKALNPTLLVFLFQHKLNERNLAPLVTIDLWTLFMSNLTQCLQVSYCSINTADMGLCSRCVNVTAGWFFILMSSQRCLLQWVSVTVVSSSSSSSSFCLFLSAESLA